MKMAVAGVLMVIVVLPRRPRRRTRRARDRSCVKADARRPSAAVVSEILRADYEGDRAALQRLHGELVVPPEGARAITRIRYWRGFALWRRVINGYYDGADRVDAAERYAKQALAMVPYWHYLRDILMPQIQRARQAADRE